MAQETMYDIVARNNNDALTGLVEDVPTYAPEFSAIPVIRRAGVSYKTLGRVGLPTAQFRGANTAITSSKSTWQQTYHEMFFIDSPIIIDEASYKADDGSTGDLLLQEGQGALQSIINKIGSQTWYGQAGDGSNGFVGLRAQLLSSQRSGVYAATPVTASNSTTSSTVYGVWLNSQGVSYQVGRHGEIAFPPFEREFITAGLNGSNAAGYFAYVSNISCWIGLSVASLYSVFGVTGVAPSTPFTDKLGAQLLSTVPQTRKSGFTFFMSAQSYYGLQASRTAVSFQPAGPAGTPAWPSMPQSVEGKPIFVTDSISNTENNS